MTALTGLEALSFDRRSDGVRLLRLDDPEKRNAIGPRMRDELLIVAEELSRDDAARALVVTGDSRSFCAGADLNAIFADGQNIDETRESQLSYYRSFLWLRDLDIPTIAAVDGHAIGAGANLALACDIIIAGPGAKFGITFSHIGLHPGGGCTYFLTQRLGAGRALQLILAGDTVSGEESVATGLADLYAEDPVADALALAIRTARLDRDLVSDIRTAVRLAENTDFDAVLGYESWAQAASSLREGVRESLRASGRSTRSRNH